MTTKRSFLRGGTTPHAPRGAKEAASPIKRFFIGFLLVSLVLAGIVSYYASSSPDGLEKVAADKGISAKKKDRSFKDSPLSDYGVKGVRDSRLSGGLAGVIGVGAVLVVGGGMFWVLRRRDHSGRSRPSQGS